MAKAKHFLLVAVLVILTTLALKFLVFGPLFQLPIRASAEGNAIDNMFQGHFWMISFLFALIMVLVLYSAVVFRRRPGDETDGPHVHGHTGLEIAWTVLPIFAVVSFGVWGSVTLNDLIAPKNDEIVINVTGRQWSWSFSYPDEDNIKATELVLAVNQPVVLHLNSEDVLHSFWVPEFRVKQDLVPGRETVLRLTPTQEGTYTLRCAEICGQQHTAMMSTVRVVNDTEFAAWVAERSAAIDYAALTPEQRGALWYGPEGDGGFGCNSCHSLDGSRIVGPSWLGIYGRSQTLEDGSTLPTDDTYIRNSIFDPDSQIVQGYPAQNMPANFSQRFTDKQAEVLTSSGLEVDIVADIIAYMKTLQP